MNLEKEILAIKERNKKVEADKAWETSLSRKTIIMVLTYFTVVIFFHAAKIEKPFINAIVPTFAFLISTLTLPLFKKFWLRYFYHKP